MADEANPSALNGVRVIDFGQYIAGPMAAMFLADQGADVVRIDPPGGPRYKSAANATWNRGKRSIVLDLKNPADLEIARKLVARADVVIENFRPGVMERLGLGWDAMMRDNPRLIYCSLPGFGHDDPRANVKAWEGVVGAATCVFGQRPGEVHLHPPAQQPVYTGIPFSSVSAAILAAVSIAMALNARESSRSGQRIEIPLYDATFTAFGNRGLKVHDTPSPKSGFNWARPAATKDGRWFMYVHRNKFFGSFLRYIGMEKYNEAGVDPGEIIQQFNATIGKRTASDWETICDEIGTEGVACLTGAEWVQHPHALGSKIIDDYTDPELGSFRGPGITPRLSLTPGRVRAPRPKLDADRDQILKEAALPPAPAPAHAVDAMRSALQGIRVLDLCIILAGPTCGRTLAEFGADVVKIDSTHRKSVRSHNDINRGKRSLLLDLKTQEGQDIFWKLVDRSDVVLQNFRMDVAEKLGVDYEAVRKRRPQIVYCSMNTFGQIGPYAHRPGHEQIAQAITGLQMRYGGDKPALAPFSACDYGTGLLGAYAVALALLHRKKTGHGQHVDSALAYTGTMLQSDLLQTYPGKRWDESTGQDLLGTSALNRAYQASDGWLFLAARDASDITRCGELAGVPVNSLDLIEAALEERIRQHPVDHWIANLTKAGIGAHRVVIDAHALMQDALVRSRGLSLTRDHADIGSVTTTGPAPRLSGTPLVAGAPASKPGSDAASILKEIGMHDELPRLISKRIVVVDGVGTLG